MIIAIDGTAGSGKGSLAKNLSTKLNLNHLDTGVLFRIIACQAFNLEIDNEDERLTELSKKLTIENVEQFKVIEKEKLKSEKISQRSSEIATNKSVRNELINFQRQALHSKKLTLSHPRTGKSMTWKVGLPEDMQKLINVLNNCNL